MDPPRCNAFNPLTFIIGASLITMVTVDSLSPSTTKTIVVLTDGVDLTSDTCDPNQPSPNLTFSLLAVLVTWVQPVASDDLEFRFLSSPCGETRSSVMQIMQAISTYNVAGFLTITTSYTAKVIAETIKPLDVPLVQMETGDDLTLLPSNENYILIKDYSHHQLLKALDVIQQLNWTAFSIQTATHQHGEFFETVVSAAMGENLCIIPFMENSTVPVLIFGSHDQTAKPRHGCFHHGLYVGSLIERDFQSGDCPVDRNLITMEMTDILWMDFCFTLSQSNMDNTQLLASLCSAMTAFDATISGITFKAGRTIAAFSAALRYVNDTLIGNSCEKNLITQYACSLFGMFSSNVNTTMEQVEGSQFQTSYRLIEVKGTKITRQATSLADIPVRIKDKTCQDLCHLCFRCRPKMKPSRHVMTSRDVGDLFIVGFFPLHASSSTAFCDVVNPIGYIQALVFLHTVNELTINSKALSLSRSIRGIVFDSCSSHFQISSLLDSISACDSTLNVLRRENGHRMSLQPDSIIGYFQAGFDTMNGQFPQDKIVVSISKSGYSSVRHPTKVFIDQLLNVLLRFQWTTLNVILSSDAPYETMEDYLYSSSMSHQFCFVNTMKMVSANEESSSSAVNAMLRAVQKSSVFLLLTTKDDTQNLFNRMSGKDFGRKLQFVFTPWNQDLENSVIIRTVADYTLILKPLFEQLELKKLGLLEKSLNITEYHLPENDIKSYDFKRILSQNNPDIAILISSVYDFFSALASSTEVVRNVNTSTLFVEATRLSVFAEIIRQRSKFEVAQIDRGYKSLRSFKTDPHIKCEGWCPECHVCESLTSPNQLYLHRKGDVILTGLFPLHKDGANPFQCGQVQDKEENLLKVLAFIFALDSFHLRYANMAANITIGGLILDSCSNSLVAARAISDFEACYLSFKTNEDGHFSRSGVLKPLSDQALNVPSPYRNLGYIVADDTLHTNNLKSMLPGPGIGDVIFVMDELVQAPYVARAITQLVLQLGWKHAFLVSEDTPYYKSIAQEIIVTSTRSRLCVVSQALLQPNYEWRLETALSGYDHFPVVLISRRSSARNLFHWLGNTATFYFWVVPTVTDDWTEPYSAILPSGTMILKPAPTHNKDFESWLRKPPDGTKASPWLEDFYRYRYSCKYKDDDSEISVLKPCSSIKMIEDNQVLNPATSYIIRTVDSIIHKVQGQHRDVCQGQIGVCPDLVPDILEKKVSARDVQFRYQNEKVEVTSDGEIIVSLNIFTVQPPGIVKIGSFFRSFLELEEDKVALYHPNGSTHYISNLECSGGCVCLIRTNNSHLLPGLLPSHLYRENKGEFIGDLWAIIVSVTAGAGVLITLTLIIYVIFKVCKRVIGKRYVGMGLFLLTSLIILFASVFPFVVSANHVICGMRFLFHGVAFGLVFSGILVKLMSIQSYKIIGLGGEVSTANQFLTVFFIVGVQIAISVQWWVYNSPMMTSRVDSSNLEKYRCDFARENFALFHSYLATVLLLNAIYGTVVRKEKKNLGEAKQLMISCWICVLLWIAWAVCLFMLDREHTDLVTCAAILACATTILLVVFVPKIRMVARLKYSVSNKDHIRNGGYSIDTDFFYDRPFSLPGTLTSNFSTSKVLGPPKPLSHFNSDVNY